MFDRCSLDCRSIIDHTWPPPPHPDPTLSLEQRSLKVRKLTSHLTSQIGRRIETRKRRHSLEIICAGDGDSISMFFICLETAIWSECSFGWKYCFLFRCLRTRIINCEQSVNQQKHAGLILGMSGQTSTTTLNTKKPGNPRHVGLNTYIQNFTNAGRSTHSWTETHCLKNWEECPNVGSNLDTLY